MTPCKDKSAPQSLAQQQQEEAPLLSPNQHSASAPTPTTNASRGIEHASCRTAVRHAEKRRTSTCQFADRIAKLSVQHYKDHVPAHFRETQKQTCCATIIAAFQPCDVDEGGLREKGEGNQINDDGGIKLTVLAMGVGTKFLSEAKLLDHQNDGSVVYGELVRDCHAEVLARRAFRRHLSLEILRDLQRQQTKKGQKLREHLNLIANAKSCDEKKKVFPSILQLVDNQPSTESKSNIRSCYRLLPNVTLHMYTSSAPCGNAVLKKFATMKKEKFRADLGPDCWPTEMHEFIPGHSISMGQFALLVKKDQHPSESIKKCNSPDSLAGSVSIQCSLKDKQKSWPVNQSDSWCPPGTTTVWSNRGSLHTCSDKICRWNCLGLQGSLLAAHLQAPVFMESLTVGRKLTADICRRAVCCRLGRKEKVDSKQEVQSGLMGSTMYCLNHPAIMGTSVYMDESGVIDMSSSSQNSGVVGQDVRFHSSLAWAWWPDTNNSVAECIDGSTGWAIFPGLSSGNNNSSEGAQQQEDMGERPASFTIYGNKQFCRRSDVSTAALLDLFLEIHHTSTHGTESNSRMGENAHSATVQPTTLAGLRDLKRRLSKQYEETKEHLLTKHPVLRDWKRRECNSNSAGSD